MKTLILLINIVLLSIGIAYAQKNESQVKEINKEFFIKNISNYESKSKEKIYKVNTPTIIYFHAAWCAPCRKMSPVIDELSIEYIKRVAMYKVDADKEKELVKSLGIKSIPTLLIIPLKGDPKIITGAQSKQEIEKLICNSHDLI